MTPDSIPFHDLPPLLVEEVREWPAGHIVAVEVLVHIHAGDDAPAVIYQAEWRHDNLMFMAPGEESDAVAHGAIKFAHNDDFGTARIVFSQRKTTATLRGSHREGSIKAAPAR
ncbi:hypothetical protein [Stenotrophomonas maltophilia]|uniref:hypothetical protein n=1 Tax=Stenotrophomonas maltophilia TaxID=40324 RepID=UPI0040423F18